MIDIEKVRKETLHCGNKLFFNSAGSSLPTKSVTEKMKEYLDMEERIGGYALAKERAKEIEDFYDETAKLLNCKPSNIAFTYNATDAYARALSAIPFKKGDVILTTDDDYISNQIAFLSLRDRVGIDIVRVGVDHNGDLDLTQMEEAIIKCKPKLVSVTHIPTNSGLIQDVNSVGSLCEKYDVLYIVDACQSVGQLPVDVNEIKCDFLSATGRKFLRGPRGSGFLYVSDKVLNSDLSPLFVDMRGADWTGADEYKIQPSARRYEMWEFSYATLLGLKEAIRYANHIGLDNIYNYNQELLQKLRDGLISIKGIKVYDKGSKLSNLITFDIPNKNFEDLRLLLDTHKVYYSVANIESARIDFNKKGVKKAIRLSPHLFNTPDEIDKLLSIINQF